MQDFVHQQYEHGFGMLETLDPQPWYALKLSCAGP